MAGDASRRIAREIRAARAYSGKSREQLARDLGLRAPATIGRWERGEWQGHPPRQPMLTALANATDIPDAWRDAGFLVLEDPARRFGETARREAQQRTERLGSEPEDQGDEDATGRAS